MKPYYETNDGKIYQGDVLTVLKSLPDQFVNCCVTSPPYWGLRSYLPDKVQLRKDLTEEESNSVEKELTLLGIKGTIGV
jgi:DNA modification methylase